MSEGRRLRIRLEAGLRLDQALARGAPQLSRSQWRRRIEAGAVRRIDGEPLREPALRLRAPLEVEAELPEPTPERLEPEPVPFGLLYVDADLIVVDKPAGVIVHPGDHDERGTLVHGLLTRFPELAEQAYSGGEAKRPGIVHRLDKGTSGVLVIARTERARLGLVAQFQARSVEKRYIAWVAAAPEPAGGTWSGPIGRHPRERVRFAVVAGGKPARTRYRVTGRGPGASARLELALETGRTHQIRVHAAAAGAPLLGDPLYGGRRLRRLPPELAAWGAERDRPALHAWRLAFRHPTTGEALAFEAPLPPDLAELDRAFTP